MQANEDIKKIAQYLSDKEWRLNNLYYIKDKKRKTVKFKFNEFQVKYKKNKHNRNIILKARQLGFTTYACIDALDNCLFNSNFEAGIICDNEKNAEKIFTNKVKFAFDRLPQWLKDRRKPNTDRAGELRFPNGSSINVSTGYRGGTLSSLHVSEYGKICAKFPEKAKEIKAGAFEAVPLDGEITVESTAEGMTGDFFEMCETAQENDNAVLSPLAFRFHFFPWWQSDEYRLNPENIVITEDARAYFKTLNDEQGIKVDDWQAAWYSEKEKNQEEMKQEYPSFPIEAFMASGRPVFNLAEVTKEIGRVKDIKPEIKYFTVKSLVNDKEFIIPVRIFVPPKKDMAYAVAGDPAEGLEDGDNSALSVLGKDFIQSATYAGKLDPDLFGGLLVEVANYYNGAIIAPELNNHGFAVVNSIKMRKYYKIFKREVKDENGKDITDKVGWLNTVKSKMEMIDELIKAFRDGSLVLMDELTLKEMLKCTKEEDGNIILNGKDRVVAAGISIQAIKQASIEGEHKAYVPSKKTPRDVTKMTMEDKLKYYKRMNKE